MKNLKIAIVLIAVGVMGLFAVNFYSQSYSRFAISSSDFQSNGERIYFTATSNSGKPIISSIGAMTMRGGMMSCAACHGADGKGGQGRMMMWTFNASDIRYSSLTSGIEGEKPYTDELIKRAITEGLDSEGKRLEPPMPVWQMSDEDQNDLLEYLKTLK
ncbi:MAG: cytochrome c [Candidatus Methanoperedens sp.]|nr:cytochrome c [Candidatus Methanoperedens sp.]